MADLTSDVQFRITQTGAKELSASLVDVDGRLKQVGQSTSNLTKFIREQRTENRQQNFIFRETKDIVTSLAFATISLTSATGSHNKEIQKLNTSLIAGFTAFQASSFAMAALGIASGGVSTAISILLGAGIGFLSFMDKAAETVEKLKGRFDNLSDRIGKTILGRAQLEREILEVEDRITKLNEAVKKTPSLFGFYQEALAGTRKELAALLRDFSALRVGEINAEIEKLLARSAGQPKPITLGRAPGKSTAKGAGIIPGVDANAVAKELAKVKVSFSDMVGSAILSMGILSSASFGLASGIHDVFRGATEGIGGAFKSMADGVIEQIARIAEALAASAIVSLLGSFLGIGSFGSIFGGLTGFLGTRGSAGDSTGNITINQTFSAFDGRGLKQTFNKPEVRNAITSAIADAARKGKV